MRKLLTAAAAASILALPAYADGPLTWTGLYVGANAGYGQLNADHFQTNGGMDPSPFDADGDGFLGSATLGYNLQAGSIVFGVEAEGGWMDITGEGRIPSSTPGHYQAIDVDTGFYGILAGRLGVTFGRTLIYGKGGYAWLEGDAGQTTTKPGFVTNRSEALQGWTYGAGVEQAITDRIRVKFEWMRLDLDGVTGSQTSLTDDPVGYVYTNSTDAEIDTFKVGVSFAFH